VSKEADTGEGGKEALLDSADMPDRDRRQEADTGTLRAGQAATALEVSERSVWRYIASGRLPAARVHGPKGVEYRIEPTDVEALVGRAAALEARSVPADEGADMDWTALCPRTPAQASRPCRRSWSRSPVSWPPTALS